MTATMERLTYMIMV